MGGIVKAIKGKFDFGNSGVACSEVRWFVKLRPVTCGARFEGPG